MFQCNSTGACSEEISGDHIAIPPCEGPMPADWYRHVVEIYARMRSAADNGPYGTVCNGISLEILPDVYAPGYFTDTEWFMKVVPPIVGSSKFLEIGTGCGAIALACALQGAEVTGVDISSTAVSNTATNFERHGMRASLFQSDVYAALSKGEKFDYIFWAHPFNNSIQPVSDELLRSGFDSGYRSVRTFLEQGTKYLKTNGKLLLGTGSSADLGMIFDVAKRVSLTSEELNSFSSPLDTGGGETVTYLLYAFS